MKLIDILSDLRIAPDSTGRFHLPWPLTHPEGGYRFTKFSLTDGALYDSYNRRWPEEEFREALRRAGRLPTQPITDGTNCVQCGRALAGNQTRFCGPACRTLWKRQAMRDRRGFKPHIHVCRECGRQFHVGRPPKPAQTM